MIGYVVFLGLCAAAVTVWRIRRARRRGAEQAMIVTTWPDIELTQRYGGWNADAYDAGTGRDHSPAHGHRNLLDLATLSTTLPKPGSWSRAQRR